MISIETIYVGIGGTGGHIIKSQKSFFKGKKHLYLDKNADPQDEYDGLVGIDRNVYSKRHLPHYFSLENRYILFLGLGGQTGSNIVYEILDYLELNNVEYHCYCFFPYSFEYISHIAIAKQAVAKLELYNHVTILNLDKMKKRSQNLSLASPFWIPNEILVEEYF